jgi:hypothetical protein
MRNQAFDVGFGELSIPDFEHDLIVRHRSLNGRARGLAYGGSRAYSRSLG